MSNLYYRPDTIFQRPNLANDTLLWFQTDEEEDFIRNSAAGKIDVYYTGKQIEYKFNSQGYRTIEIEDFEDDFVLAMGCSYTEGVGNLEKDTWPALLGKQLSMPCYNFGISGSGTPIHLYNTFQWIKNNYPLPKAVVFQLPEASRIPKAMIISDIDTYPNMNSSVVIQPSCDEQGQRDPDVLREQAYIEPGVEKQPDGSYQPVFPTVTDWWVSSQQANIMQMLWNSVGVPVIQTTFSNDGDRIWNLHDVVEITGEAGSTYGRDCSHQGRKTNHWIANALVDRVKTVLAWDGKSDQPFMRDSIDFNCTSFVEFNDRMDVTASRIHKPFIYE